MLGRLSAAARALLVSWLLAAALFALLDQVVGDSVRWYYLGAVPASLLAGGFLFFLILVSGGFFFYVALAVAGIVALGFFHYMLWGYAMTQEVADEQARDAAPEWSNRRHDGTDDNIQHRRF